MNSYLRDSADPRSLVSNQEIVEQHMDDLYLIRYLTPGVFVPFSGAAYGTAGQSVGLGKWPTIDYPDATASYATTSLRRPAFWIDGNLKVSVFYTSQTGSTTNFRLLVSIGAILIAGNYSNTGVTALQAIAVDVPGPATADDKKEYVFYTSTARLSQRFQEFYVRVGRDTPDASTAVMQMTGVLLEYIPVRSAR